MIGSVYCLFEGGTLDGMCVLVERTNDEWPPSRCVGSRWIGTSVYLAA
jgi:hypothetical protein